MVLNLVLRGGFQIRVISGSVKGRRLKSPGNLKVRPTADRVKEALFNIIRDRVPGSIFLDLFAGTGNIGIEALSRGASMVVFVEQHYKTIQLIKENLDLTGLNDYATLLKGNIPSCFSSLGAMSYKYDLIFMDPPYLKDLINCALSGIDEYDLLLPGGQAIVECSKLEDLPLEVNKLRLIRQEKYGDTILGFYMDI
jgi:16S rRNA (guanine(966)-N(2))-methyltransferase RsmD